MRALILDAEAKSANVQRVEVPRPVKGEVLVRVEAVALNPVDSLYTFRPLAKSGRTVGSDFAGVVVEGGHIPPGTRVAGFLQGACSFNERPGAFAEYLVCPEDLVWKIPDSYTFEEAATISLCGLTAAQALFTRLHLPAPFEWDSAKQGIRGDLFKEADPLNIFIYGASTSVALYAAQLLQTVSKTSNHKINLIGSASKAKFTFLKEAPYSYNALVDYKDEDWTNQAYELSNGIGFHYAFDCISEGSTVRNVSTLLCPDGKIAVLRSKEAKAWDPAGIPDTIQPIYGAAWEGLGVEIQYQAFVVKADPQARAFACAFYEWLSTGARLQANPVRLLPGGLDKIVQDGFQLLGGGVMQDRVIDRPEPWMRPLSAEKVVYQIPSKED